MLNTKRLGVEVARLRAELERKGLPPTQKLQAGTLLVQSIEDGAMTRPDDNRTWWAGTKACVTVLQQQVA